MKKIAVIGGDGMLGRDLVAYLSKKFEVTSISKTNYKKFVNKSFEIIINANGNSKRFWANENIIGDFEASTISVYKSLFDFNYNLYIYISSSDVYMNHEDNAVNSEDSIPSNIKLSPYGFHKFLSEKIVINNCPSYLILRSSLILGTGLKKGPIFDIFNKLPLRISEESKLQMITAHDIARIIISLLNKKITNEVFNIGGRGVVNFSMLNKYFKDKINFSKNAETQIYEMNVEKINKIFPILSSSEYLEKYLNLIDEKKVS